MSAPSELLRGLVPQISGMPNCLRAHCPHPAFRCTGGRREDPGNGKTFSRPHVVVVMTYGAETTATCRLVP